MVRLNWNEDGTFPKGTPDPFLPKNRKEIAELIVQEQADMGAAWDADADRAFFFDEKGRLFPGYYINALLIEHFLKKDPNQTVIIEPRLTWATKDIATKLGGNVALAKVGHTYIKNAMRDNDGVFGGESSGHFYYKDFYYCDNGAITFLLITGIFTEYMSQGKKVSELLDTFMHNFPANLDEHNFITDKAKEIVEQTEIKYDDALIEKIDGLSVEYPDWRFNMRTSNTEPVLRVNIEAKTPELLEAKRSELLSFVETFGATLRNDS